MTEDEVVPHAGIGVGQHRARHYFRPLLDPKLEQRTKGINELRKTQRGQNSKRIKVKEPKQIIERDKRRFMRRGPLLTAGLLPVYRISRF